MKVYVCFEEAENPSNDGIRFVTNRKKCANEWEKSSDESVNRWYEAFNIKKEIVKELS